MMLQGKPRANPVLGIHEGTAAVRVWHWEHHLPAIGEADRDWGFVAGFFPLAIPVPHC